MKKMQFREVNCRGGMLGVGGVQNFMGRVVMRSGSKSRVRVLILGFGSSSGCNLQVFIG